jgi:cytochrome c oxidase subunit 1
VAHFHYVLSMGAVFGIFAGIYYWFGKMTGYTYSEFYGKLHFWLLFVGVNLTFYPMHFLGLAGMPRRIPDFPDSYAIWNDISSIGSLISIIAIIIFFYTMYRALADKIVAEKDLWKRPDFYRSNDINHSPSSMSSEWIIASPPSYHTFNELPVIK